MPTHQSPVVRLLQALPDAGMAAWFMLIWLSPLALGPDAVRAALMVMLVEFILVHASGLMGGVVLSDTTPRRTRLLTALGLSGLYLLFIAAFTLAFASWWPALMFGWLLAGKLVLAWGGGNDEQRHRMFSFWVVSAMAYLGGVTATVLLPLPRFGLDAATVQSLDLPGSGHWVELPHTVVAFGALYFATLAIVKFKDWRLPATTLPGMKDSG